MVKLPQSIEAAVQSMTQLPSVGEKSAMRMVLAMSRWSPEKLQGFIKGISGLSDLRFCLECGFFAERDKCDICLNIERTESKRMCIVESSVDLMAIERSMTFDGTYHVLGGVLNPLIGVGPKELNLGNFAARIKELNISEIIFALNPSLEGDATCAYIRELLPEGIKTQRIGFGVPIGGSLEYLDSMTIGKAIENRKDF